jgi:pentatricopeptide repeat protein
MIHGFSKHGNMEKANNLFLNMEKEGYAPDVISFNTLLRGFCNLKEASKVIELLVKMREKYLLKLPHDVLNYRYFVQR